MGLIYKTELPFPPSVWSAHGKKSNGVKFRSKTYKAWLSNAPELILPEDGMITKAVSVIMDFYFPDKRRRDLDNYAKVPLDYLVSSCVLEDDNNTIVRSLEFNFLGIDRGNPRVEVSIYG